MRYPAPLSALACVTAASLASTAAAEIYIVNVFNFDFSINQPGEEIVDVTINLGDTVRWHFIDSGHSTTSVVGIPESWNSGYVGVAGTNFDHTFTNTGTFWYYCFPHGFDLGNGTAVGMTGTVTVVPAPGSALPLAGSLAGGTMVRRRRRR